MDGHSSCLADVAVPHGVAVIKRWKRYPGVKEHKAIAVGSGN